MRQHPTVRFQTHINENREEMAEVSRLFPWANDYLGVYERFDLIGRRSVLAHGVWSSDDELTRLASASATVAHCPCSNAALGSGLFPLRRYVNAGVRVALGTDVAGGTGYGVLKEALQAYLMQRVAPEGCTLTPAQLLYLSTRAGAEALGLEEEIGDFQPGKAADFVCLRPPPGSALEDVIERTDDLDRRLATLFTLGDAGCVREVRVAGEIVYRREEA
jgi:guanine deaminase